MNSFLMNKKVWSCLILLSLGCLCAPALQARTDLPPRYQKWLDEEVAYIITRTEKDVFLKLTSDKERDLFIEAFWKHRDPTPATPDNEFKTEHYRRINYTNHFFGRQGPRPGWKTDRGRVYIILGEPNDIQRFEGRAQIYPAEVWFYQDKANLGLPPGFHIVFFQKGGIGEFKLYSPARDGPQALLTGQDFDPADYMAAYTKLRELEPSLADVSLSLVPGEETASIGRPSLASDLLIQRVETTPERQVEEKYARKFLEYKDIVDVEYTANYMDSESLVKVIKDPSGLYFVHFAIEPARLSVGQFEKKYYANLKLNGSVTTPEGKPVYQFEKTISIDLDEDKMAGASRQPLNIHDMFPLVPGKYRLSLLLKNEVSKEFTSLEQTIAIPREDARVQITSLILGYRATKPEGNPATLKPFRFGAFQVYCQPNRVFLSKDSLSLAFQVHGLPAEARDKAELKFTFLKNDQEFRSFTRKVAEYAGLPDVLEEVALGDFAPAHYRVQVALTIDGAEVVSAGDEFDVTALASVARPWFYSKILPASSDPIYDYVLGTQLYNIGQVDAAIVRLERASRSRSDSAEFALNLAQAYMAKRDPEKIVPLLQPFFKVDKPPRYEIYLLQGKAYQKLEEWDKAIGMFDGAIAHYGINPTLLNAAGECYFEKGDLKAALVAWDKSLKLNPDQPVIRKKVETLEGKNET
jgi:GWxTD domain-containing protein